MSFRTTGTALIVLLAGCSGTTGVVNLDAPGSGGAPVPTEAGASVDSGSSSPAPAQDATAPGDAAPPDSAAPVGPVDSGLGDGGAASAPSDGGCVDITATVDAGSGGCSFTTDDLACTSSDDCRTYEVPACACAPVPVIGVNRTAAIVCVAPHCVPPAEDGGCYGPAGYQGQDCVVVGSPGEIAVDCVNGRCISQAIGPGH